MSQATPSIHPAEAVALERAWGLAATPGVPLGPNPRVGCVLIDASGNIVGEGYHRGAGHPHAEVVALGDLTARSKLAGDAAGASAVTAVVTLEPCNHWGRTGPCSVALVEAGVRRVVYAASDPTSEASGGGDYLRQRGIEVVADVDISGALELNRAWLFGLAEQRPLVTWKFATSLDGRSAAADGTSRWVSNGAARRDTHLERGKADTIMVGTNTVIIDDPALTLRDNEGRDLPHQLLRVVMGLRDLDSNKRVFDERAPTAHLRTRDPRRALTHLFEAGQRHVFLEGGPTLGGAFLKAGLVDEVIAYVAPMFIGGGRHSVEGLGIETIADALHLDVGNVEVLGERGDHNLKLRLKPYAQSGPSTPGKS